MKFPRTSSFIILFVLCLFCFSFFSAFPSAAANYSQPVSLPSPLRPATSFAATAYVGNDNAEFTNCNGATCTNATHITAEMILKQTLKWKGESKQALISLQYNPDYLASVKNQNSLWFQTGIIAEEYMGYSCLAGTVQIYNFTTLGQVWANTTNTACLTGGFNKGAHWQITETMNPKNNEITKVSFLITTSSGNFSAVIGKEQDLPSGYY